jgi:Calcium-binding EGF domain
VVVEKVNSLLEGVVDVEVEWTGLDLQGGVGEHLILARVTRLATPSSGANTDEITVDDHGRELFTKCYHVPFEITDIDECRLPDRHPMRHQCHPSAVCVNTIGSYECVCPRIITADDVERTMLLVDNTATENFWRALAAQERGPWELSLATSYFCPNQASTHGCCPSLMTKGDSVQCRRGFYCPVDPCKNHDCGDTATCVREPDPMKRPNSVCKCPEGLLGNGRRCQPSDPKPEPKVKYDGKTPTELTVKNDFYCGCTKPVVDHCDGFPPCKGWFVGAWGFLFLPCRTTHLGLVVCFFK